MKLPFNDYLMDNQIFSIGQPSGDGGAEDFSLAAYRQAGGGVVPASDPGYQAWVTSKIPQVYKNDLMDPKYAGLKNIVTIGADGQANIPDGILASNMKGPQFLGFDRDGLMDYVKFFAASLGGAAAGGALSGAAGAGTAAGTAGLEAGALVGAPGYGAALGNSLAGAGTGAASWGVNQNYDWGGENMFGFEGSGGGWDYNEFLQSIGVDPASTQYAGGTMSNADILSQIMGGSGSGSGLGLSDIAKYGKNLMSALGGSGSNGLGLLGGGLGALLGGMGANGQPAGTTTTVQDIPDWLKPYVIGNLSGAAGAQSGLTQNNGVMDAATAQYLKTINGDYLDPLTNPYLDATYKQAADKVGAGVDSRFSAAGRYGSGAHQGVLQEGMNNLATNIYGGNYQAERSRQAAATGGAPTFQTGRAGAAYAPYSGFADLFPAGVRSTSTPYFSNTAGGILSGALAGSQLSKLFG